MTHYLPIGYTIQDPESLCEYTIKQVLGRGASTIAYLTTYSDGSGYFADRIVKEYYPSFMEIVRDPNGSLRHESSDLDKYKAGVEQFICGGNMQNELRKRTYLRNETPPLQRIFEANNTHYFDVTPFEGRTFDNIETFTLAERIKICLATAKLINRYHQEGFLYLDLKPQNIFVLTNSHGEVVTDLVELIDFDSVTRKDQIAFGKSLSFTKSWAAPEQTNPYSYRTISEATDIYALGELVFWSIWGRHSTPEEHRGFSLYPFSEVQFAELRRPAQNLLFELFRKTLRSSTRNRYSSVQPVIDILARISDDINKREYIIESKIRPNMFFVGRESEIHNLSVQLNDEHLIFLQGIGGIGKSEIAKQYAYSDL